MEISSKNSASAAPSNTTGVTAPVSQPNKPVDGTAEAAKAEIHQVATHVFQTKSEVGGDLERLQKTMDESIKQLSQMLQGSGRNLSIGVDKAVDGPVVTVRNSATGEVVRQIPNETVVQIAHSIEQFKGWLHDVKV